MKEKKNDGERSRRVADGRQVGKGSKERDGRKSGRGEETEGREGLGKRTKKE